MIRLSSLCRENRAEPSSVLVSSREPSLTPLLSHSGNRLRADDPIVFSALFSNVFDPLGTSGQLRPAIPSRADNTRPVRHSDGLVPWRARTEGSRDSPQRTGLRLRSR